MNEEIKNLRRERDELKATLDVAAVYFLDHAEFLETSGPFASPEVHRHRWTQLVSLFTEIQAGKRFSQQPPAELVREARENENDLEI